MAKLSKCRPELVVLIIVILLQVLSVIYIGTRKGEFFIDEVYSFTLSNSGDMFSMEQDLSDRWLSPEDWDQYTTVQADGRFAYGAVYRNNAQDAHPPLYYWILHTVCSLFPGRFNAWLGIGINLFFFAAAQIFLYLVSEKVIANKYFALLPAILWGNSAVCMDTVILIRMYALVTLLTMISLWLHLETLQKGQTRGRLALMFAVTFLGVMTHYYFAVIAFCISGVYCLYCFVRKAYRQMLQYGILELLAVVLLFVVYPAAFTQITGSETNNVGVEIAASFFSLSGWAGTILEYFWMIFLFWGKGIFKFKWIVAGVAAAGAAVLLWTACAGRKKTGGAPASAGSFVPVFVYAVIPLLAIVITAKMSNHFVYTRYVYHIVPILICLAVMFGEQLCIRWKLSRKIVLCILVLVSLINLTGTVRYDKCEYLFRERRQMYDDYKAHYGDIPVILLCDRNIYVMTDNLTFLQGYSHVYITDQGNVSELDTILEEQNTEDGVLCMIWVDQEWDNGYDSGAVLADIAQFSKRLSVRESVGETGFCEVYYFR